MLEPCTNMTVLLGHHLCCTTYLLRFTPHAYYAKKRLKILPSQKKPFGQAVHVQRSSLLSRGKQRTDEDFKLCDYSKIDFITSRFDLSHGVFTGGCGHHMHAECWKS